MVTEMCWHLQQQGEVVDKAGLLLELSKILDKYDDC